MRYRNDAAKSRFGFPVPYTAMQAQSRWERGAAGAALEGTPAETCLRAHNDRAKRLFREVAFGDVMNEADHADNISVCVELGSKSAGFPNVVPSGRVLGNEDVGDLHQFSSQSTPKHRLHPACAQTREDFHCNLAQYLLGALTRQALPEGIKHFVAKFAIINNDALTGVLDDRTLNCMASRSASSLTFCAVTSRDNARMRSGFPAASRIGLTTTSHQRGC